MAKKYRQSSLKLILNVALVFLYERGFLHSLVWHLVLLLWLALLYPVVAIQNNTRLEPISLSFSTPSEIVEPTVDSFPNEEDIVKVIEDNTENEEVSSIVINNEQVSAAENMEDIVVQDLDVVETTLPEYVSEIDRDHLTQPIKTLLPELKEVPEMTQTDSVDPQSISSDQRHPLPGLPRSLLAKGDQTIIRMTSNVLKGTKPGEINKRLKKYGAQTGDVQISLGWDTIDDLDLHVTVNPPNSYIFWRNKTGNCGGVLDIDMNFHPQFLTNEPIENVFWAKGAAPRANYVVSVHYYMSWSNLREVQATLIIKVDDKTETIPVAVRFGEPPKHITTFSR